MLVRWLEELEEGGFPVCRKGLAISVKRMLNKFRIKAVKFVNNRSGYKNGLFYLKKDTQMKSHIELHNSDSQHANVFEENIKIWFDDVKKYFMSKDLLHILIEPR